MGGSAVYECRSVVTARPVHTFSHLAIHDGKSVLYPSFVYTVAGSDCPSDSEFNPSTDKPFARMVLRKRDRRSLFRIETSDIARMNRAVVGFVVYSLLVSISSANSGFLGFNS